MSSNPLDALLDKLCSGDPAAAEQVFRTYEPYLRMVVRKQLPARLRPKFDSVDIVQSVWADVLDGFREAGWRFPDANQLRAFLVTATRNRFIDRQRQHRDALEHERPVPENDLETLRPARESRPSEVAQAKDLWEQMLALCPPAHHDLLRLKRQGLSVADVAARTGLHPSTVRRILSDLARRLAAKQGASARPSPATL